MAVAILQDSHSHNPPCLDDTFDFSVKNYDRVAVGKVVLSQIVPHYDPQDGNSWQIRLKKLSRRSRTTGRLQMECQLQLITHNPNDKCKLARVISYNWDVDNTKSALFTQSGDKHEFCGGDVEVKMDRGDFKLQVEVLKCVQPMLNATRAIEYPKSQMFTAEVSKWFESENFGDTTVVASDGMKFRCHRDVLVRRSKVFRLMFTSQMKESRENLVKIDDFDGQIVAAMLQFLYSDECSEIGPIADRLYAAAHRYELCRLKNLCETSLAANLSENSVKTQQLAELYNLDELKLQCDAYWESQNGETSTIPEGGFLEESLKLNSKFHFTAENFQRWPLGTQVLSQPFFLCCSWQLELTKTGKNQVRIQLQLVDVRTEMKFPQIAIVRLVDDDGEEWFSRPLVCFYRSGDKFNFGPSEVESTTTRPTVEVEIVEWEESASDMPHVSDMATDVRKWIESEDFGDTTVVANDGKKFRCHRDILARRCEVLLSKSSGRTKKAKKNVVDIADLDGKVVSALLQFLYSDQIDRYDQFWSTADHVYLAADHYKLDRLKNLCEYAMANSLSVDSVMQIYRLATIYHLDKLLAVCVDYLDCHKDELNIGEIVAEAVQIGEDKANGE